ncbi:MAG: LacI family DNA-binding transcriptional regulator [Psychromonas sp.]
MATIKDVSELAQVSQSTVSRVLTGHARVAVETKEKVLKAIEQLDFQPNLSAQSLASKRTNSIGMLVGTLAGGYFSSLTSAAEETARESNFHLIATSGRHSRSHEVDAIKFLKSKQVDGLIIHTGELSDDDILKIVKETPATVLLNHYIPEIAENCIYLDDELGGYLATKHLLDNGHTKIGCITGPLYQNVSRDRLQGYRNALTEYGIQYDPNLVVEGRFDLKNPGVAPRRLLDRNIQITAIFCLNDHIALEVYEVLNGRGISIGNDISVVGFDNDEFSAQITPKLTTVNFPVNEMGIEAAKKVLSLINKNDYPMPHKLVPELIIRDSVKRIN